MNPFDLQSYDYALPKELIATTPASPRESAKLLIYNRKTKEIIHSDFYHFLDFIPKDSIIVLNDTKVIKARVYGHKSSGGKSEILFHRFNGKTCICQVKNKAKLGTIITLDQGYSAQITGILEQSYKEVVFFKDNCALAESEVLEMFNLIGHIPLPPYIKREDCDLDVINYQSVFAKNLGSVAAPTASLHFSKESFENLKSNFQICYVTLHIGAGTFFNVESSDIREHKMHSEFVHISRQNLEILQNAKKENKKILCIGTTALRSVEFIARSKNLACENSKDLVDSSVQNFNALDSADSKMGDFSAQCDLFLYPSNPPIYADFLLTNFHFPKSSLIMLIASMTGLEECHRIYQEAIAKSYRFYSYGDGMLIL